MAEGGRPVAVTRDSRLAEYGKDVSNANAAGPRNKSRGRDVSLQERVMWMRLVGLVMALVISGAAMATAQVGAGLGPKDGGGFSPTDLSRVAVGGQAPDFTLESKDALTVTLSSFRGHKDVVLVFYRGHW